MVKRRVFDEAFREMAVGLPCAKESIQGAPHELGVDPERISKWRQRHKKTIKTYPSIHHSKKTASVLLQVQPERTLKIWSKKCQLASGFPQPHLTLAKTTRL